MLRLSIYALIPLLLLALIFGCDDNPSSPEQTLYSVSLSTLPDSISSPQGVIRSLPFTVTVINVTENLPVVNEDITITVAGRGNVIPAQASTDNDGFVDGVYEVSIPLGESSAIITAHYGDQSDQATISLYGTVRPVTVSMTADPPTVVVQGGGSTTISLAVYVADANGVGVSNQPIRFTMRPDEGGSMFGALSPSFQTDQSGNAVASFSSQGGSGRMVIKCAIDNPYLVPELFDETTIEVIQMPVGTATIRLSSNTNYIFADYGTTTARITALLQNQRGEGVANELISYTVNNNGVMMPGSAVTDAQGITQVELTDIGLLSTNALGEREPCKVIARSQRYNSSDSIYVDIRPPENVVRILLSTERQQIGINGRFWVRASCFTDEAMTRPAPSGKQVRFTQAGGFSRYSSSLVITNENGIAETQFLASPQSGTVTLNAEVRNQDDLLNPIYSNEVQIGIIPGPPVRLTVEANPYTLTLGEIGAQSTITSTVSDSAGNPVSDGSVLVQFESSLGTLTPSSAQTENGRAISFLRPEMEAGVSTVTATVETEGDDLMVQTYVQFTSGVGSSIELSAEPLEIHVGGQITQSTLRAVVRDMNGNPVATPTKVVFELITNFEPPHACNINDNDPFNFDTIRTDNGMAVATLNAGIRTGPQLIHAYTLDFDDQPTGIEASLNSIVVVSGTPVSMVVDLNNNGLDAGGGAWQLEVSARVYDIFHNPVVDRIPVLFSIGEDDIASIEAGYTGNRGLISDPTPGVAFTRLTYNGRRTFQPVTIIASVQTEEGDSIGSTVRSVLPLQQGSLSINIDPSNWMFEGGEDDTCEILVWANCQDGHNTMIDEAPIIFSTSRGRLYPTDNEVGSGAVLLRGTEAAFFLNADSNEEIIEINASIEGYNVVADSVNVTMTRRQGE